METVGSQAHKGTDFGKVINNNATDTTVHASEKVLLILNKISLVTEPKGCDKLERGWFRELLNWRGIHTKWI